MKRLPNTNKANDHPPDSGMSVAGHAQTSRAQTSRGRRQLITKSCTTSPQPSATGDCDSRRSWPKSPLRVRFAIRIFPETDQPDLLVCLVSGKLPVNQAIIGLVAASFLAERGEDLQAKRSRAHFCPERDFLITLICCRSDDLESLAENGWRFIGVPGLRARHS